MLRRGDLKVKQGTSVEALTHFTYDDAGRFATIGDGTNTATYGYLTNSRQVDHIVFHSGTENVMRTSKHWDSLDRLTLIEHERLINISQENPATISSYGYTYNTANQRVRVDEVDGSYWVYGYDDLGQLTSGKKHFADESLVPGWQFEYGYDDIGNREFAKEGGDSAGANLRESVYQANELNQYDSRTVPGAVDVTGTAAADADVYVNRQPAWRKDAFYQGLVEAQNSAAPAYPEIRVDAIKPGAGPQGEDVASTQTGHSFIPETPEAFGYDDDGNMIGDGRWVYTWNGENRLVTMETATAAVAAGAPRQKLAFAYDHVGRRTTKKVYAWDGQAEEWALTKSIRFLYDGWNLLTELEPEDYQVGEGSFVYAVARSYVWGLDLSGSLQGAGGIGGLLFATGDSTTTMPTCDGNGNVVQYVALDASVPFACAYSPFGQTIGQQGQTDMPYRFSSKYQDESEVLYFGYRYFASGIGRWMSKDIINEEGGPGLYTFAKGDPVRNFDFLGKHPMHAGSFEDAYNDDHTAKPFDPPFLPLPSDLSDPLYDPEVRASACTIGNGCVKFVIATSSLQSNANQELSILFKEEQIYQGVMTWFKSDDFRIDCLITAVEREVSSYDPPIWTETNSLHRVYREFTVCSNIDNPLMGNAITVTSDYYLLDSNTVIGAAHKEISIRFDCSLKDNNGNYLMDFLIDELSPDEWYEYSPFHSMPEDLSKAIEK